MTSRQARAAARWRLPGLDPLSEPTHQRDAERGAPLAPSAIPDAWQIGMFDREGEQVGRTRKDTGPLDTSAQLGQGQPFAPVTTPASVGVAGLPPTAVLLKRARRKFFSFPVAKALADLRSPLEQSYRNAIYCNCAIEQAEGKATAKYCGTRWCLVCNAIRTARATDRYLPVVSPWVDEGDGYFVTLTLPNMPASELPKAIRGMIRDSQAIKLGMRRTDRVKLVALRKLECTYNARTDDYHPHFHFVVKGENAAGLLLKRWLERHPDAVREAQHIRPCDKKMLREMFKYFTKLVAKQRRRVGQVGPCSSPIPPVALDQIFQAMHRLRVYQPVGFVVAKEAVDENADIAPEQATAALTLERKTWNWSQGAADWVDESTGECLSGYEPAAPFRAFVATFGRPPPDDSCTTS